MVWRLESLSVRSLTSHPSKFRHGKIAFCGEIRYSLACEGSDGGGDESAEKLKHGWTRHMLVYTRIYF